MTLRRRLTLALGLLAVAGALALVVCPRPTLYGDVPFSSAVLDRDGRLLRLGLARDERYRLRLSAQDIAPVMAEATILYEDRYFRRHPGINPVALLRAAWSTYVSRERVIGASTLTMQLARLRFDLDTRTPAGKLRQMARALQLERHYSKQEVLEAYLNLAPYGGNVEGVGAASLIYFDKPASKLSLAEALALAVIPQHPARRHPATPDGYREVTSAQQRLLARWRSTHTLTPAQALELRLPLAVRSAGDLPFAAPHESARLLAREAGKRPMVTSTIELSKQRLLEERISAYVQRRAAEGIQNASAMLLDYASMDVLASVGSADFFNDTIAGQVDGTTARRSPGSTLKPFAYGLAMDRGLIHPMSMLKDAPRRFAAYTPENFDRGFMGPIVARDALVYSRNVPAIQLLSDLGLDTFHEFLEQGGVDRLEPAQHYGLAMILGGNELSMRELVRLYAMVANGGELRPLNSQLPAGDTADGPHLLSAEASYLLLDMLRHNPRPGESPLPSSGRSVPAAWKTGTSYAYRDAWSVGVIGPYVLAVWVGNFDGSSNPAFVGREAAAPLFFAIADSLSEGLPTTSPAAPSSLNLRAVDVCAATGDLPGRHCPATTRAWFIPGVSPIRVSDVHRAIRIDNATGLRACEFDPATTHEAVFEFWSSDLAKVFRQAGIALRTPPPWHPNCSPDLTAASGNAPRIVSPLAGVTYHVRHREGAASDHNQIAFQAVTDANVRSLYWFINDRFVERVARDKPLLWPAKAGTYTVVAVDDAGRSHSRPLSVKLAP